MGIAIAATSYPHRKKEVENSSQNIHNTDIEADKKGNGNEVEMTLTSDDIHDKGVCTGGTDCRKVVLEVENDREQSIKQEKVKEEKKKDREVAGNILDQLLSGDKGGNGNKNGGIIEGENVGVKDEEEDNAEEQEEEEEEEEDLSDEAVEARHEGMLKSMRDRWATLQKLRMERKYALLGIPFNWDEGMCVCAC